MAHPTKNAEERRLADEITSRIARAMAAAGFTQSELARELGCTQPTISEWFSGSRRIPLGLYLAQLPRAFRSIRLNGHWLLTGEGQMTLSGKDEPQPEAFIRGQRLVLGRLDQTLGEFRREFLGEEPSGRDAAIARRAAAPGELRRAGIAFDDHRKSATTHRRAGATRKKRA